MSTSRALLDEGIGRLRGAGLETPRLDAELLLGHVLGVDRTTILAHPEALVGDGAAATYRANVERRLAGEPVAYIRAIKEFHGIALTVDGGWLAEKSFAAGEAAESTFLAPRQTADE